MIRKSQFAVLLLIAALGTTVASAQTTFVRDNFTGVNGTTLQAHASNVPAGGTWTRVFGQNLELNTNRLRTTVAGAGNAGLYLNGQVAPANQYVVGVNVIFTQNTSGNNYVELYGRADATALNGYMAHVEADGTVSLNVVVGGTVTSLPQGVPPPAGANPPALSVSPAEHHIQFVITTARKSIFIDGVEVFYSTNNTVTTAGQVGIGLQSNTAVTQVTANDFYAGTFSPTAATLDGATATREGRDVLLEWRTANESRTLGYHVYRQTGTSRVRLDDVLIGGSVFQAGPATEVRAGNVYRWLDRLPDTSGRTAYWVEEIDAGGVHRMHGPFRPASGTIDRSLGRSPLLRELNQRAIAGSTAPARAVAVDSETAASKRRAVVPSAGARLQQFEITGSDAIRLSVRETGWYRVTQPELVAGGLSATDPRNLQLFVDGKEIPIVVNGEPDGHFDALDSIEFYGTALDTPWTDVHSYYLRSGPTAGARVRTSSTSAATPVTAFTQTVERRDRVFFLSNLDDDDSFFGPVVSSDPIAQTLRLRNLAASGDVTLSVSLVGTSDVDDPIQHQVTVDLNGHRAGELSFSRVERAVATFRVPREWVTEGDNVVALRGNGGEHDYSLVDSIRIAYPHTVQADEGTLLVQLPAGSALSIGGLGTGARAIDITNPLDVSLVASTPAGGALTAGTSSLGPRTLFAFDDAHVLHPAAISARKATNLNSAQQSTDLLIVTHRNFRDAVEPLRALRVSQGLDVSVVDVQDVFDEFGFGAASPAALREFFKRASTTWAKAPSYVLLAGDSTFDPRDYLGKGPADFIPSKMLMGSEIKAVSDAWLTDFNNDGVEDIPIGRLPVRTPAAALTTVAKIVAYDAQPAGEPWTNRVVLVSGDDPSLGFASAAASVEPMLPGSTAIELIDIGASGTNAARQELLSAFNQGALVIDYVGHGSVEVWNNSGFFNSVDVAQLSNGPRLPFVVAMTCLNGEFNDIYTTSLAESLLNAPNGGAVAVWASSSLTEVDGQKAANLELVHNLFPESGVSPRIGDAVKATKLAVPEAGIRTTWNLFGDPSMKLRR
jgi:hypothetical protein